MSDSEEELRKQREKLQAKKLKKSNRTPEKDEEKPKKRKHSDLKESSESSPQASQSSQSEPKKREHKEKKSKTPSSQESVVESSPAKSPKKTEKKSSSSKAEVHDTVEEMDLETVNKPQISTPMKEKLTFSYEKPDNAALPFIMHFPQGIPPEVASNPDEEFSIENFKNAEKRKQHQLAVICETEKMQYIGKNYGSEAMRENLSKFVIGIHNKKTGKVKLVEAQAMFSMAQKVKNVNASLTSTSNLSSLSNSQKKLELVTAFGSKRLQKAYIRDEGSVLDKTTELTGENELLELLQTKNDEYEAMLEQSDASDLYPDIPPADFKTPETRKVYDFNKMILSETQQYLRPIAEEFAASVMDGEDEKNWAQFVKDYQLNKALVSHVVSSPAFLKSSNEKKTEKCIMLLYFGILMKLYKQIKIMQKDIVKREETKNEAIIKKTGIPEFILRELLRIFCSQNPNEKKPTNSLRLVDITTTGFFKIINYMIAILLMFFNFNVPVKKLSPFLEDPDIQLPRHLARLGCDLKYQKDVEDEKEDEDEEDEEGIVKKKKKKFGQSVLTATLQAPLQLDKLVKRKKGGKSGTTTLKDIGVHL